MGRLLVIDHDRLTAQRLGLACLDRAVGVAIADKVCDGVRALLAMPVSLIVVDAAALRLTPREHATLFHRVAPGVPVVVSAGPQTPLDFWAACEEVGFRVRPRPVAVDDLLDAIVPAVLVGGGR